MTYCTPVVFSRPQAGECHGFKLTQKLFNIGSRRIIFTKGNHAGRIPMNAGNAVDKFPGEKWITAQHLDDLTRSALVIEFSQ